MNGLIQHLSTSGIDLSENNVIGIQNVVGANDYSAYKLQFPEKYLLCVFSGYYNPPYSQYYAWGGFEIDRAKQTNKRLFFYHIDDVLYISNIQIDSSGYIRVIGSDNNYNSYCAVFLKS